MADNWEITLRSVEPKDLTTQYVEWLNDPDVNRFLETRFAPQSRHTITEFWRQQQECKDSFWFAICLEKKGTHIGNIKLGSINWIHRRAEVSLFLGEKEFWGKGIGLKAVNAICGFAFNSCNLIKVSAGAYSENHASIRLFKKAGFSVEGVYRKEMMLDGRRVDAIRFGLLKEEWERNSSLYNSTDISR
jgi:[ribosomal protein S5]-alanine N-acetyltransferase